MNTLDEDTLIGEICSHLDYSIKRLDPALAARLDNIRISAVTSSCRSADPNADAVLIQSVQSTLDRNLELPPSVAARLDSSRRQALMRLRSREDSQVRRFATGMVRTIASLLDTSRLAGPAGMMATACVLVTVVSLFYVSSRPTGYLTLEDEISLIASAEDFELYENLEFYLWLAENGLPN